MKFDIAKKELLQALKTVAPAVANRSSLPILVEGVRLEAVAGRIALEATDLEFAIRLQVAAETSDGHGRAVVPAKFFIKAVSSMPDGQVEVEFFDSDGRGELVVCAGTKSVRLQTQAVEDWPEIGHGVDWHLVCEMDATCLSGALQRVIRCASQDEARPVLTGVQFNLDDANGVTEMVATDSYRLGVVTVAAQIKQKPDHPVIVPARVLKSLAKQLGKDAGTTRVYAGNAGKDGPQLIEFTLAGAGSYVIRQIEGEFPNWKQLVPETQGGEFEFDTAELKQITKDAAALRSQKNIPIRIELGDDCRVQMMEQQTATFAQSIGGVYSPNGTGPMVVAFNPEFLLDGIEFVAAEKAQMWVKDASKPALLTSGSTDRYVLMPVRLP